MTALLNKSAKDFPNRRAVSLSGRLDLTHAQLQQIVDHAASLLISAGINPGDVVALTFPNTIEVLSIMFSFCRSKNCTKRFFFQFSLIIYSMQFVVMFLAVIRCRATAAPLNQAYTAEEFEFYLSDSESKLLIMPQQPILPALTAASKLKIPHVTSTLDYQSKRVTLSTESESVPDAVDNVVKTSTTHLTWLCSYTLLAPRAGPKASL